jgi:hypothetical protein
MFNEDTQARPDVEARVRQAGDARVRFYSSLPHRRDDRLSACVKMA